MPDVTQTRSEKTLPALGIWFEEYEYPHPVKFLPVSNDGQPYDHELHWIVPTVIRSYVEGRQHCVRDWTI
jgi:hypothetical protein